MRWDRAVWIVAAGLLAVLPVQAQWKWKDANGQVHISDLPPPRDVPDKDVLQRPTVRTPSAPASAALAAASQAASGAAPRVDPELEARRNRLEQDQKAKAKAAEDKSAAQRAENCQRARQQIATLDSGIRLARVNEKGEREVLDDKARAEEAQRARSIIATDCR